MVKTNSSPELIVNEIQDIYVRENFLKLREYFQNQNQLLDFKFFEVSFDSAQANRKVLHGLSFIPTDIIITGAYGESGTINVGLFDSKNMDITATGKCKIRFFAGRPWNSSNSSFDKEDAINF